MKVIGLAGWSGAGKTTLLSRLVPHLVAEGLKRLDHQARTPRVRSGHPRQGFLDASAGRRDRGADLLGAALGADARAARRAGADAARAAAETLPVDLVIVEGFKSTTPRKIEVHRPATASRCCIRTTRRSSASPRMARSRRGIAVGHLDDITGVAAMMRSTRSASTTCSPASRVGDLIDMAQLSDDCFAFGGPLMSVDEAVAIIAHGSAPSTRSRASICVEADGRVLAADHRGAAATAAVHELRGRRLRGAQRRPAAGQREARLRSPAACRPAPQRRRRLLPGEAVRIFTGAPMPGGADTVFMQEDVRIDDAGG